MVKKTKKKITEEENLPPISGRISSIAARMANRYITVKTDAERQSIQTAITVLNQAQLISVNNPSDAGKLMSIAIRISKHKRGTE